MVFNKVAVLFLVIAGTSWVQALPMQSEMNDDQLATRIELPAGRSKNVIDEFQAKTTRRPLDDKEMESLILTRISITVNDILAEATTVPNDTTESSPALKSVDDLLAAARIVKKYIRDSELLSDKEKIRCNIILDSIVAQSVKSVVGIMWDPLHPSETENRLDIR